MEQIKVEKELLKWSDKLPNWQKDALRRIWTQGELSEQDEEDILKLLKDEHDLSVDNQETLKAIPLAKDHIGSSAINDKITILKSMSDLENVNAIRSKQTLCFGEKGITVIYGDNATGKSGYSRVLKRSCRARGTEEVIYQNVYSDFDTLSPAKATFEVSIKDEGDKSVTWTDGSISPECLANIAVFDSKVARIYVDEANEVKYIPYGLDVFTKLANLCIKFQSIFKNELSSAPKEPAIIAELVGEDKTIIKIKAETTKDYIDKVAKFEKKDIERLSELTKLVADYKANDPKKKADSYRRQESRINQLRQDLFEYKKALSKSAVQKLKSLWIEAKNAQEAALLASEKAFYSEPLAGTGNDVWRIMFDAAKKFSEHYVYPSKAFPVTDEGSRCLLCQQLLDDEGKDRLQRFWNFIRQDTTRVAAAKSNDFEKTSELIKKIDHSFIKKNPQLLEEIREFSKTTAIEIEKCYSSLSSRVNDIEKAANDGTWNQVTAIAKFPAGNLSGISKYYKSEAKKSGLISEQDEQEKIEKEVDDLSEKKKINENKATLLEHIKWLKTNKKLEQCLRAVGTTGITRKQSELMEKILTKNLEFALKKEFSEFGVKYIPIQLKKIGNIGSTYHQLKLPGESYTKLCLSEILSGGEHRIVAIASFLAELNASTNKCGIIFDDPVSSLDQRWRERVATRLVKEGKRRQVIIFTHDIVFFNAIETEAGLQQVQHLTQMVTRTKRETGICSSALINPILKTKERIKVLRKLLNEASAYHEEGTDEEYREIVKAFYDFLRSSWERAIEEILLQDVILRFRGSVETKRLSGVVVEHEDYVTIYSGMTRCSNWIGGHDHAAALGSSVPLPDVLKNDLSALDEFYKQINKRVKKVGDERKLLINPPTN